MLNDEGKVAYLKRISFDLEEFKERCWAKKEDLQKWLDKYQTTIEAIFEGNPFTDNALNMILISEPPSYKETFLPEYNKDTEQVQRVFYNYYYGVFIDLAIQFLKEQETKKVQVMDGEFKAEKQGNKLKTKLSVPELAYFFRALEEEGFFEIKSKTELYNFIAGNFKTKQSEELSPKSIKNKYTNPEHAAIDFLHGKFINLAQRAKKEKEK